MANVTESATYDAGVYQIETTDPVSGGAAGIANKPIINLANRTAYLKGKVDGILGGTETLTGYAKTASPTFTGNPAAPTPALGDNDTSLATTAFVQGTVGGVLSKSVAGSSNVTLTAAEAGNAILVFTGALTANISVIVPTSPTAQWIVKNGTSGAFTLTVKTAAGTGVVITQGKTEVVYTDGTNVLTALDDFDSIALSGTPTAPTAAVNTSSTQIATTAFVNAEIANDAAPIAHVGATGAAHGVATTSVNGFMSSTDKSKLDSIATGATSNGGTVTSVGLSLPTEITVTGSPVTGSGTLTGAWASQTAKAFLAAPNGENGTPSFRAIVASDIPTLNQSTTGNAANVTGTVAIANGGTGATNASAALTNLGAAPLSSPVFTGNPTGPTPLRFDNDTSLATTAWVKGEGIQAANVTTVGSTPYTITDLQAGHIIYITTGGSVVTLPDATAWPVGKALIIQSAVSAIINRYGTQTIYCNSGGQNSISLGDGDSVTLYAVPGFNGWIAVGNSGQLGASSAFNYSIAANGYQKLPTKLIVQWGGVIVPVGAYPGYTGYFPISFPNGCLAMTVTHPGVATSVSAGGAISASQFVLTHSYSVSAALYWIAIGY